MATPTIEEYLETIYSMEGEGAPVISARVAERMGVAAPTMTDTLRRLVAQGYVEVDRRKEITLTPRGREAAESLVRRHRLSERWLIDVLGLDWAAAHQEACRLEHALSSEVEERLARSLDNPTTCPHGNPIPGAGLEVEGAIPLDRAEGGDRVVVVRISHAAEEDPRLLDYLQRSGVVPGADLTVAEIAPWAGLVTLSSSEGISISLGLQAAAQIWVRLAPRS